MTSRQDAPRQAGDCVTIGTPKPGATYHYTRSQSNGATTQSSHQWESVTPTGSKLKTTGPGGTQIQVNEHEIVDNVAVLTRTSRQSPAGAVVEATSFAPGILSDPAISGLRGPELDDSARDGYLSIGPAHVHGQESRRQPEDRGHPRAHHRAGRDVRRGALHPDVAVRG